MDYRDKQIYFCGGGRHTEVLLNLADEHCPELRASVKGVVDDNQNCRCAEKFSLPVYPLEQARELAADFFVLSTYDHEPELLDRLISDAGIAPEKTVPIYTNPAFHDYYTERNRVRIANDIDYFVQLLQRPATSA